MSRPEEYTRADRVRILLYRYTDLDRYQVTKAIKKKGVDGALEWAKDRYSVEHRAERADDRWA